MELDITQFFREAGWIDYSASRAEIGDDAGPVTWRAACEDADEWSILTSDQAREAFRHHVRGYGAWSEEEIAAWSDTELNALCMQCIAGDAREVPGMSCAEDWDWEEYERLAQEGTISSRLFEGIDGRVYYYIGN
jgi:hypothetical protein